MYPWHIGPLDEAIKGNVQDYFHNNRGANKWQIVYIGPDFESCAAALAELMSAKEVVVPSPDRLN